MAKKSETAAAPARKRVSSTAAAASAAPEVERSLSGTAAAVKVLKRRKNKEMGSNELVAACLEAGWTPGGKTPKQTLVAAIQNEIKRKKEKARFAKGDSPGTWKLSSVGAA